MKGSDRLLSRRDFREQVFSRGNGSCEICATYDLVSPAVDAHHIIERRLWPDGGYYLDNGASVCGSCHLLCEQTQISVVGVRSACGITNIVLPPGFYPDKRIDKWGNSLLDDGRRLRDGLFYDESVQKVLRQGGVYDLYESRARYPRTMHLPYSESVNDDDRVLSDLSTLKNSEVVVTVKLDGESTTIYQDGLVHARSPDGDSHPSQAWVRNFASKVAYQLDPGYRICGENMYAKHSIKYGNLESFFSLYSVWDERNMCLSWDDTKLWANVLDIPTVPEIYRGPYNKETIHTSFLSYVEASHQEQEGYVIRSTSGFSYIDFQSHVAKWVRPSHIQETVHNWRAGWYESPDTLNTLRSNLKGLSR